MSSTTTDATTQTGNAPGNNEGGQTGGAPATQRSGVSFTSEQQEHIDRLIADRLARQKVTLEGQTRTEREKADREAADREAKELGEWRTVAETKEARLKEYEAKEQAWEREKRDLRLQTAITAAATKAGATNPEILHRLVDFAAVEWNDTGQPKNLTALVNELKREYPAMFRTHGGAGSADAGAGNGGNHAEMSMNTLIRRAAGRE